MFGKWFGRRKASEEQTYEPATAAPAAAQRPTRRAVPAKVLPPEKSAKGFDPYNSGAFKRKGAWEKVPRL